MYDTYTRAREALQSLADEIAPGASFSACLNTRRRGLTCPLHEGTLEPKAEIFLSLGDDDATASVFVQGSDVDAAITRLKADYLRRAEKQRADLRAKLAALGA